MKNTIVKAVWILTYFIFWVFSRIIYPVKIFVDSKIYEARKPTLIISNHKSILDPWFISGAFPFKVFCRLLPIRMLSATDFQTPLLKFLRAAGVVRLIYAMYGVLEINRQMSSEEKLRPVVDALKKGETVFVFPEGGLCHEDGVNLFKRGAAFAHEETGAPIIPCAIRFVPWGPFKRAQISLGENIAIPRRLISSDLKQGLYFQKSSEFLRARVLNLYNPKFKH